MHLVTLIFCQLNNKNLNYTNFYLQLKKMNEQQLAEVYEMVDSVPFSRQKKNIGRDFSDALMMAELIHNYYPKKV